MARIKKINKIVSFTGTNLIINDLGPLKEPRYELYDIVKKTSLLKSNNPKDFDYLVEKKWKKNKLIDDEL